MKNANDVLIEVGGVSKKFCRSLKAGLWYGVCDIAWEILPSRKPKESELQFEGQDSGIEIGGGRDGAGHRLSVSPTGSGLRPYEFWAVDGISFELRRGECIGLLGRNGAGKTTLLKMLNGLIKPDRGRIEMRGRVGALIALGAGFNPVLTGRENIYVNGSVLGLTKRELDGQIESIIDFAEIREFIDSPVQSYSSGMQVRLGFAVATALEPDILILDEVLAVGDAGFRAKCYKRISELRQRTAIIFVSHSIDQVAQVCDRVLVLNRGAASYYGPTLDGLDIYAKSVEGQALSGAKSFQTVDSRVTSAEIVIDKQVKHGANLIVRVSLVNSSTLRQLLLRITIFDNNDTVACEYFSGNDRINLDLSLGGHLLEIALHQVSLKRGHYKVSIALTEPSTGAHLVWSYKCHTIEVDGPYLGVCPYIAAGSISSRPFGRGSTTSTY